MAPQFTHSRPSAKSSNRSKRQRVRERKRLDDSQAQTSDTKNFGTTYPEIVVLFNYSNVSFLEYYNILKTQTKMSCCFFIFILLNFIY